MNPAHVHLAHATPDFAQWADLLALLQRAFAFMDGRIDPRSSLTLLDAAVMQAKAQGEHLRAPCHA